MDASVELGVMEPAPPVGVSVVYVLFDVWNEPAYVGSTQDFRVRLAVHRKEKPGLLTWTAFPCADREAAYVLENRLLKEYKPHLNKKASR